VSQQRQSKYKVLGKVGLGATGTLYKASQVQLDRVVAIKVLDPVLLDACADKPGLENIFRSYSKLEHPNINRLIEYDMAGKNPYFVAGVIEGKNLGLLLTARKSPSLASLLDYVAQAAMAVQFAHEQGLLHGDIKPENVLVTADGSALVTDFGIGLALVGPTGASKVPRYISPEQAHGKLADEATDIYGLGALLFDVLTGAPPRGGSGDIDLLKAHLKKGKTSPLPPVLVELVAGCLETDPGNRPDSAEQVAVTLQEISLSLDSDASYRARRPRSRGPQAKRTTAEGMRKNLEASVKRAIPVPTPMSPKKRWALLACAIGLPLLVLLVLFISSSRGSAKPTHTVTSFEVIRCGSRAALVAWKGSWRATTASFSLDKEGAEEARELSVQPLFQPDAKAEAPYDYVARIGDLETATRYAVALEMPDGKRSLPRNIVTKTRAKFEPVRKIQFGDDGTARVIVEAKVPFSLKLSPAPDVLEPARKKGMPSFSGRFQASYTFAQLSRDAELSIRARTLDGEEERLDVNVKEWLVSQFDQAISAFEKERKDKGLHALLADSEGKPSRLLREGNLRKRSKMDKGDSVAAEKMVAMTWRIVREKLETVDWYQRMKPLIPGIPSLLKSEFATDDLRQKIAHATMPFSLVQRGAIWYELGENADWVTLLAPANRPFQVRVGRPYLNKPASVLPFTVMNILGQRDWYLMFDDYHPKFKVIFSNPLMKDMVAGQRMTVNLSKVDMGTVKEVELELSVRTAVMPVVMVVSINKGRFFAVFEDSKADVDSYDTWRRESGANVREVAMMLRGDLGEKNKFRASLATIGEGLLEKPRRLYQRIPISALARRNNEVDVYPVSSPIDSFEYVAVTGLKIRLASN